VGWGENPTPQLSTESDPGGRAAAKSLSRVPNVAAPRKTDAGNHATPRDVVGLRQLVEDLREQNAQLARQVDQLQAALTAARAQATRKTGERRIVTVLFADLRDSTPLAEDLSAENMIELLNAYLGALARCVLAEGGMVDKFLGDGLMAVFGVLDDSGEGADGAARAVIQMRRAVQALNDTRAATGEDSVSFGVGVHTGEVVFGPVGLPGRSDYTAIGDTVNTAARLSGLCREFGVDAIFSNETAARLELSGMALRELGSASIRGKARAMIVSTLA
jgi:class 3 adenylate cyclase